MSSSYKNTRGLSYPLQVEFIHNTFKNQTMYKEKERDKAAETKNTEMITGELSVLRNMYYISQF